MAGTILAMATFMVVGLLKLSDEMSYRAKVDAKVSQIMKTRATMLVNMSFQRLRSIATGKSPTAGGWYEFINGQFNSSYVNNSQFHFLPNGNGFPFLEVQDPFTWGTGNTGFQYLLTGKPLPGDTSLRQIFPFVEVIRLQFVDNGNVSQAINSTAVRRVNVEYDVWWVNEFIRSTEAVDPNNDQFQKLSSISFEFVKYDPTTY